MLTNETFIEKANEIHNAKYDYSKVNLLKRDSKGRICIICHEKDKNNKEHGEFWQTPSDHLRGKGCKYCGIEKVAKSKLKTRDSFIEEANEIHKGYYKYNLLPNFFKRKDILEFICPKHGIFKQSGANHLSGKGCKYCGKERGISKLRIKKNEIITRCNKIHNNKYTYDLIPENIQSEKDIISIKCPFHGYFEQSVDSHLRGHGCPKCGVGVSIAEEEIINFIKTNVPNIEIKERDRKILNRKEIDIFFPNHNIGIEYNGLHWHNEKHGKDKFYHYNKYKMANHKQVKLYQFFEDEYRNNKEKVCSFILSILNTKTIKNNTISEISSEKFNDIYNSLSLKDFSESDEYYIIKTHNKIIATFSFKVGKEVEICNIASLANYTNLVFKIVNFAKQKFPNKTISAILDLRLDCNFIESFYSCGFYEDKIFEPTYKYTYKNHIKRYSIEEIKCIFKELKIQIKDNFDYMCDKMKIYKIWDCGQVKVTTYVD